MCLFVSSSVKRSMRFGGTTSRGHCHQVTFKLIFLFAKVEVIKIVRFVIVSCTRV